MQPRLLRSRTERMIAGVCGGIAEYLNVDPTIVRLLFVLVTLLTGAGIFFYPLLWLIMPRRAVVLSPTNTYVSTDTTNQTTRERVSSVSGSYAGYNTPTASETPRAQTGYTVPLDTNELMPQPPPRMKLQPAHWVGILLIGTGAMVFAEVVGIDTEIIGALFLVAIGALLMLRRR